MRGTDNKIQMKWKDGLGHSWLVRACQLLSYVWLFVTPWTVVHHTPLSTELSRQQSRVAVPFSRVSSWPRDWTWVSCNAGRVFTIWATRESPQLVHKQYQIEYHQSPVRCISVPGSNQQKEWGMTEKFLRISVLGKGPR